MITSTAGYIAYLVAIFYLGGLAGSGKLLWPIAFAKDVYRKYKK